MYLQAENPSGADLNALGLYMIICLIFVVGALIEFAVVVLISRSSAGMSKQRDKSPRMLTMEKANEQMVTENPRLCWNKVENSNEIAQTKPAVKPINSLARTLIDNTFPHINNIDLFAFCAYFCLFVLFNCIYWTTYLANENS